MILIFLFLSTSDCNFFENFSVLFCDWNAFWIFSDKKGVGRGEQQLHPREIMSVVSTKHGTVMSSKRTEDEKTKMNLSQPFRRGCRCSSLCLLIRTGWCAPSFSGAHFLPPTEKCTFSFCHARIGRHLLNGCASWWRRISKKKWIIIHSEDLFKILIK